PRITDPVLHRPSNRRPKFQRTDTAHRAWEFLLKNMFELAAEPLARGDVLCDDHELAEEIVGQLDTERQIEADSTAPDISAPSLDVGIVTQDSVELRGAIDAGMDRRVLRQPQID